MPEIRTVSGSHTREIDKVRGSRFIADAAHAADERAASDFIESVREREPDATHHCWALKTSDGVGRSSDDGEPHDTAGPPILRRIEGAGLTDVVVVVTRYYGGTNLGRGGLIRAYGAAAAAVLDGAPVVTRPVVERVGFEHPYDLTAEVATVVAGHQARVVSTEYAASVRVVADVPMDRLAEFVRSMADATAGVVEVRPSGSQAD